MSRRVRMWALSVLLMGGTWPMLLSGQDVPAARGPSVHFSFDQVEIRLLVKLAGEMTGRRFVVDDSVSGKVTVVTPQPVPLDEVFPLLQSVLESAGYSLVDRGEAIHVIPLPKSALAGAPVVTGADTNAVGGVITKVIAIRHVSAVDLRKLLEPLVRGGKEGAVSAFAGTNHLIITDTAENIRQAEKLIAELDQPGAARAIEVVPLKYATASELADQLQTAVTGSSTAGDRVSRHLQQVGEGLASLPPSLIIVPALQANSLVLVGTPVQLTEIRELIARMDTEPRGGFGRLHVIFLRYLSSEEAAKNLNALLSRTAVKDQRASIAIEPSPANNALLVESSQPDFEVVRDLVQQLDQVPQQVLVEVLIAEVSMDKNLDLGVQLASIDLPASGSTTVIGRSRPGEVDTLMDAVEKGIFPQGLAVGVARGTYVNAAGAVVPRIPALVQALARNRDVKILSNIPLWAQNNIEASVSVVENIPILRSTIEGGSGTSRDVIQNIDRMDVGIKLKLTPHVNPDKEVTLKLNPSIEAIINEGPSGTAFAPTIAKREVSTTVTLPNEATVVLSGLIREDRVNEISKVPLLGDIPVLGWLFRSKSESTRRTNLLIFVTPHLVGDMKDARKLQRELEDKTGIDPSAAVLRGGRGAGAGAK